MDEIKFDRLWNKLTPRQRQVYQKLVAGEIDDKIAASLFVTPETIRKHIEAIVRLFFPDKKARSSKRSELVRLAARYKPELFECSSSVIENQLRTRTYWFQDSTNTHQDLERERLIIADKRIPKIIRIV